MKIRLDFKTSDVVFYALQDIDDPEEKEKAEVAIAQFVRYGENVSIEIDTETNEAKVMKR